VRFLFDCGQFGKLALSAIALQDVEIEAHRFVTLADARDHLSGPVRRRVLAAAGAKRCLYLEDGRPVAGVTRA
jgi:hypothetical protein